MPALQVMQSWLDEAGNATLVGDWDTYRACVVLPFHLITEKATMVVDTEDVLRRGFDEFRQNLAIMRVTDYIRLGESAAEIGPDLIAGRYVTHLMSNAHRIVPPFRSHVTLRRQGNRWCAASIVNALSNTQWPIASPSSASSSDEISSVIA